MLRSLYSALWYPALPIALAATGTHGTEDRRERLGRGHHDARAEAAGPRIWIHAASVGEIEAARPIAAGLRRQYPSASIVITTMTPTGRDAARRRLAEANSWLLAPFDCPATVRAFLARARPNLVLIMETELWPNFFHESHRGHAKIAIVNGRVSRRSLRRYQRVRPLFGGTLECADLVLAQSGDDADRFITLGAPADRVFVTGNTKFDPALVEAGGLRAELEGFAAGQPLLIAGSTAPGEEAIVARAFVELRERFADLALVIAPRHPARTPEVEEVLNSFGLRHLRASALEAGAAPAQDLLLILDTMGELRSLYRRATVAFVGGSLTPSRGGQNVAEPAAFGVPVLFGPHYENHRDMATALLEAGGAKVVREAPELTAACAEWLSDPGARQRAGEMARAATERAAGGARATLKHLQTLIANG